ncbi:hypothetical protein N9F12_01335 [Burkholderiaceae bacterium]|nr:hypothetical protein [Burkholderiaceae bacterium]
MATLTLNTTAVPASLANLNMSDVKKPKQQTAVQMRRNKLSKQLWEQVQLATALATGGSFAPIRVRTVKDKLTGERKTVEQPKRVKPWWFTAEDGTLCLQVRYGVQVLEIGKGKNTITLASKDQLVETLNLVKQAAEHGELDKHIAAVATKARLNFTR